LRVAVLGASGFIGRHLSAALHARGDEVVALSLREPRKAAQGVAACDAVVNLAGESLGQRWNADVKRRIMESRSLLPAQFFDELAAVNPKPAIYVCASAIGYYGTSESATFTENNGPGNDFLAQVCVAWESTGQRAKEFGARVAMVRSGLVLGSDGGALAKLLPIFKAGTGGRVGSGKQWYSWIHIDDAVGIYLLALDRLEGALNATAPNPVQNEQFTHALAEILNRPAALPAPAFMVKVALGEGATIVLEGQRVLPQRALLEGYTFKYPTLDVALRNLLS
jgi:uncharacterized protein (TIGR01777 family)